MLSPTLIVFVLILLASLFSQFGKRLAAVHSLVWWPMAIFLLIAVIKPYWLTPIASFFGINLVSNFFLATMILFLFSQVFLVTAQSDSTLRKLREVVCSQASETFKVDHSEAFFNQSLAPKVLIILPCFNEHHSLNKLVPCLQSLKQEQDFKIEFCFINDGSSDGTKNWLEANAPHNFVSHLSNMGVAATLLTGFKVAERLKVDFVVQCDSDGQHPIQEIPKLLNQAHSLQSDLLIGSRFTKTSDLSSTTKIRRFGSIIIMTVLKLFWPVRSSDPTSGFRVFSRKAYKFLGTRMPDEYPEPEIIAVLALENYKISEISVKMVARVEGKSSLAGVRTARYMVKVVSALLSLRTRSFLESFLSGFLSIFLSKSRTNTK